MSTERPTPLSSSWKALDWTAAAPRGGAGSILGGDLPTEAAATATAETGKGVSLSRCARLSVTSSTVPHHGFNMHCLGRYDTLYSYCIGGQLQLGWS